MSQSKRSGDRAARWLRWIARLVGTLLAAFWLFSGIVSAIGEPEEPWTIESTMIAIFILALTAGVLVAWWRAGIGGTILTVCGVAFGIFGYVSAGHNKGFAVLVSGVPVLVTGLLFLAAWWVSTRSSTSHSVD